MKIVEAMKKLRVIEKRMKSNSDSITKYSSMLSTERPYFPTEDDQRDEIRSLVQSNTDLFTEYLGLKKRIEKTNIFVTVELGGKGYSLSDLLVIKRKLAVKMIETYSAMNDKEGHQRIRNARTPSSIEGNVNIVRFYVEDVKNKGLREWQDLYDNIDSRLEVINATTDLVE